jgi:AcrR family transcriptional regulator
MPRLTPASVQERRDRITAAALRCFARQGFARTSMADIISESGLSAGSIYSHFEGKADIVRCAAASELSAHLAAMHDSTPASEPLTPRELTRLALQAIQGPMRENADMLVQIWAEAPRDPEIAELARDNLDQLRQTLARALGPWAHTHADPDPEALARRRAAAITVLLQGCVTHLSAHPAADLSELAAELLELLDAAD